MGKRKNKTNKLQYRIFRNQKEITIVMEKIGQETISHTTKEPSEILQLVLTALDDNWTITQLGGSWFPLKLLKEIRKNKITSHEVQYRIEQWQRYFDAVAEHFKLTSSIEREYYELQHAIFNVLHGKRCGDIAYHPLKRYLSARLVERLHEARTRCAELDDKRYRLSHEVNRLQHEREKLRQQLGFLQQAVPRLIEHGFQQAAIQAGTEMYLVIRSYEPGNFMFTGDVFAAQTFLDDLMHRPGALVIRKFFPRHETTPVFGQFPELTFMELVNEIYRAADKPPMFDTNR